MNTRKLFVAILMTMVMAVVAVSPALAYQPEIVNLNINRHWDDFAVCDGYNVIGDFDVTRKDITFFDKNGNATSVDIFVHYVGTLTNSVTGKSLDDKGNVKNTINFVNGTFTQTGGLRHTTVPGLGIVIQETGRIIVDDANGGILFVTPGMSVDEAVQLCAALQ